MRQYRNLEQRLLTENPRYRTIWIVPVKARGERRVVLTLFPQGFGDYEYIFGGKTDFTYESINEILQKHLELSN